MNDTFGRCNKCGKVYWDSPLYMKKHGIKGCPRCGANETRWAGRAYLARPYLLYMYFWETNAMNQKGQPGDPDPLWWISPIAVLMTIWRGLRPDLSYGKKGEADARTA